VPGIEAVGEAHPPAHQRHQPLKGGPEHGQPAGAAALSIRRMCEGCAPLLAGSVSSLLELYRRVQVCGDVAEGGGDAYALDEEDVQQVVEGVALVAAALPDAERRRCVQQMMDVVVAPMQQILGAPAGAGQPAARDAARLPLVLPLAERVTTIFKAARDPPDVAAALLRLWPWLEAALDAFGSDVVAAEKICKAPRYAVRSAGKAAAGAVPQLAAALPRRFEATGHSCYLYVASELVKTFGDEPGLDAHLGPMLARMLLAACTALRTLADVTAAPDIADDTFLLAGRGLSYSPRLVITPQLLPTLLAAARAGLLVQHREACCSIAAFLVRVLDPATHRRCPPEAVGHLREALGPHAPALVRLVLAGAAGALPSSRLQELTDVLYAVLKVATHSGLGWVGEAVAALPEEAATAADKQRFMAACQAVVEGGMGVDDEPVLAGAVAELSELCRRTRRVHDAAQRALLPADVRG
jgi:transportin-3